MSRFTCSCGECRERVERVLAIEDQLCQGAKLRLTARRKAITRERRKLYFRDYYRRQKAETLTRGLPT